MVLERPVPVRKAEGGFRGRIDAALTTTPFPGLRFPSPPIWPCLQQVGDRKRRENSLSLTSYYVPGLVSGAFLQGSPQPAAGTCVRAGDGDGQTVSTVAGGRWEPSPSSNSAWCREARPQAHSLLGTPGAFQPLYLGLCPSSGVCEPLPTPVPL